MAPPPSSSSDGRNRRHVTTACVSCRESKIKCDGNSPTCSNCESKGRDCRYQAMDDKRKLTVRFAVDLLAQRIEHLTDFLSSHNLETPDMKAEDEEALRKALTHLRMNTNYSFMNKDNSSIRTHRNDTPQKHIPSNDTQPSRRHSESPEDDTHSAHGPPQLALEPVAVNQTDLHGIDAAGNWADIGILSQPIDCNPLSFTASDDLIDSSTMLDVLSTDMPTLSWPWSIFSEPNLSTEKQLLSDNESQNTLYLNNITNADVHHGSNISQSPNLQHGNETSTHDNDEVDTLLDQLSNRIASLQIGPNGQVRYYGATSNFNLVDMPAPDNLNVHRTVRNDGQKHLHCLGLGKPVPDDLEEHLANLYFTWHDPTFHAVNREAFESAKTAWRQNNEDTPYFSEALQNAICCLGAAFESRYHPTFTTFPKSLSDFFADRAKALLEIELDCPSVATVQAMMVLSSHDIGCKRDARGWLFSGMAMRLAFDLALHIDMAPYVANKSFTQRDADLRRDVFWGAYVIDHMWGFHLGRPFRINMEDVTVEKPPGQSTLKSPSKWVPYESQKSSTNCVELPDCTEEIHRQRVLLVDIMAPLGYALYGNLKIPASKLQTMNAHIVGQLLDWKQSLPSVLQVDLNIQDARYLPHVILLHMHYHQNLIHAHRPWMSPSHIQPNPPQGPGPIHAQKTCVDSALSIATLVQLYESYYPLRRMNIQGVGIVCSAALLLIFASVRGRELGPQEHLTLQLSACFRALDEFGASWESAKRAREFLILLQRRWEHQAHTTKARRASQAMPDNLLSSKRNRVENPTTLSDKQSNVTIGSPLSNLQFPEPDSMANLDMNLDLDWIIANSEDAT